MINKEDIEKIKNSIVESFNPDKIILYGSYAYGTPNNQSDIDLLIVMPFEGRSSKVILEIWKKIKPDFSIDLIVRTPDDFQRRYIEGDPLIGDAVDKGKVLYERCS